MERKEKAIEYFKQGYNCSQAVTMAFADVIGEDAGKLAKMSVGLGGGVGRMREVCGTVTGMAMVLGMIYGDERPDSKNDVYPIVQEAIAKFKEANGSIICRELLEGVKVTTGGTAEERTDTYYKIRPCVELVGVAAEIVDEMIKWTN